MLSKIYLGLLLVAVILAGFFAYYGWSWLGSIGEPRAAWAAYNYHWWAGIYVFLIGTVVLLVAANVILWKQGSAWALGVTQAYLILATLTFLVLLRMKGITFCTDNAVCEDLSRAVGPLLTALSGVGFTGLLFLDLFVVRRLREKIYGTAADEKARHEETES